jgi:hypothetical protein
MFPVQKQFGRHMRRAGFRRSAEPLIQRRSWIALVAAIAAVGSVLSLSSVGSVNATVPAKPSSGQVNDGGLSGQQLAEQKSVANADADLSPGWRTSNDAMVSVATDADGVHLYRALEKEAFTWRAVATLHPAGVDSDSWIDELCVTGDRRYAVVTVAPGAVNNNPAELLAGGTAYVVDLETGRATVVADGVAMLYHTPGCGDGANAVVTRYTDPDLGPSVTELIGIDAAHGRVTLDRTAAGQYTSAVPVAGGIVAYRDTDQALVDIAATGAMNVLTKTPGTAYDIRTSTAGGVQYLTAGTQGTAQAWWFDGRRARQLGSGPQDRLYMFSGHGGPNILYGASAATVPTGAAVRAQPLGAGVVPVSQASLAGDAFGQGTAAAPVSQGIQDSTVPHESLPQLHAAGGNLLTRTAPIPAPTAAAAVSPSAATDAARVGAVATVGAATQTPTCAVPRNDPQRQVLQPNGNQVQWATELATRGLLGSSHSRPANYANMGLASYTASGDLPPIPLRGGNGTAIPPQVMYAVMAQESAWKQASFHALPGIAGNPNVANYYGTTNFNNVNYANADCGYGISQVTSGMRLGDTLFSTGVQAKIAVDYAENIAAGLQILASKWNQLYDAGITANNADPQYLENWYFAVWAYNSGVNPGPATGNTTGCTPSPSCTDAAGNWGLGWTNNPLNTSWDPHRDPFLRDSFADAAQPQRWPYQEKIFGWMETPVTTYTGAKAYSPPTYHAGTDLNLPQWSQFCTTANSCVPNDPTNAPKNCTRADFHCWWHGPVTWANCTTQCATYTYTWSSSSAEPAGNDPHPPDCNLPGNIPASAVVVDDLPNPGYNLVGCGAHNWHSSGSFALTTGTDSTGAPVGQIDLHQAGAGFGGHLFFAHDYPASDTIHHVMGTWTDALPSSPYHVMVHIPSTGGTTTSAHYQVRTANGTVSERTVDQFQSQDEWVGLGYFQLGANAQVTLDNVTDDGGLGDRDVAFDAIMFIPVPGTVVTHTFDAVSLITENQDLNTNTPAIVNTPQRTMQTLHDWALDYADQGPMWNNPSTTHLGIAAQPQCSSSTALASNCVGPQTWAVANTWANDVRTAGTSPTNHPPGMSEAVWLGYAGPGPTSSIGPSTFADDATYKGKEHLDVSFVIDSTGKVVPGSAEVTTTARTGTTHLAPFMRNFILALSNEYGITPPNFRYNEYDANAYSGDATPVDPLGTDLAPGRAYVSNAAPTNVSADGQCVETRSISGGSDGYRSLVANAAVTTSIADWVTRVQNDTRVNSAIGALAGELYNFYFNPGRINASLFNNAPPIWQNLHLGICANGNIYSTETLTNTDNPGVNTLVDQSYVPDLYLYEDGQQITQTGAATNAPGQAGRWDLFTNLPTGGPNAYGACASTLEGNGGNPWAIEPVIDSADVRPNTGSYCDTGTTFGNPWNDG